jgi:hypothetical protein
MHVRLLAAFDIRTANLGVLPASQRPRGCQHSLFTQAQVAVVRGVGCVSWRVGSSTILNSHSSLGSSMASVGVAAALIDKVRGPGAVEQPSSVRKQTRPFGRVCKPPVVCFRPVTALL